MLKYIKLIFFKFAFILNYNCLYYPSLNLNNELDCYDNFILKPHIDNQFYIFNEEIEKIRDNWNEIKKLLFKKFSQYYQIGYNFLLDGSVDKFVKKIKVNKFIFRGFKYSENKTKLVIFYNYENIYKSRDSTLTFSILPERSEYYTTMLQDSIIEINKEYEILKVDKNHNYSFNFFQLYWNSVIIKRLNRIVEKMNSKLNLNNFEMKIKMKFFIFDGYEKENSDFITFLYRYYLFNNNYLKWKFLLK